MATNGIPNWIDAHAHLTDGRLHQHERGLQALLDESAEAGITQFVLGGIDPEEWERQKALHELYPRQIFPTFGLHPWWVAERSAAELRDGLNRLQEEVTASEAVLFGLGETIVILRQNKNQR